MSKIAKKQKKEIEKFFTEKLKELYYFCKENDIEYLSLCNFATTSNDTWATYRFLGQSKNNYEVVTLRIEDDEKEKAKRIDVWSDGRSKHYYCPSCEKRIGKYSYCKYCGQKLKGDEEDE